MAFSLCRHSREAGRIRLIGGHQIYHLEVVAQVGGPKVALARRGHAARNMC